VEQRLWKTLGRDKLQFADTISSSSVLRDYYQKYLVPFELAQYTLATGQAVEVTIISSSSLFITISLYLLVYLCFCDP
jgi:hypothetical protein